MEEAMDKNEMENGVKVQNKAIRRTLSFLSVSVLLLLLLLLSANLGSISVTFPELIGGLFFKYDENVAIIYDLRFPRIMISMLSGAALAVSGVLFQAVMKNPLADPGIIGISSGASFTAMVVIMFFPGLFFLSPLFAFAGGIISFLLVYLLSWKSGLTPLRLILVGIAVNAVFMGLIEAAEYLSGSRQSGAASIVNANITMKTWGDVNTLWGYVAVGLAVALLVASSCNLLALDDKTVRSLGVNVTRLQIMVSIAAVLLASITTAVAGVFSFVGLIGPHMARVFVGSDHKVLIPFSILLGSFIVLLADTLGRLILQPYEIPASVVMAVLGGSFFIFLLLRSNKTYGN